MAMYSAFRYTLPSAVLEAGGDLRKQHCHLYPNPNEEGYPA